MDTLTNQLSKAEKYLWESKDIRDEQERAERLSFQADARWEDERSQPSLFS